MLYDKLKQHAAGGFLPMHMPGHKRNAQFMPPGLPFDIDITELHGFDDLHYPDGILLETAQQAAELYGSREAFLLINGTTVGILAAIGAHAKRGEKLLAVDNCHWSIPNAAELFGLELIYINAVRDETTGVPCSVTPATIKAKLEKEPDIKLVIITSPTYEGVVSDIASIAEIVHTAGGILIVDSAHGAHLGFLETFPQSAVTLNADIVVMSLHKTLPALTQCSLLHVCSERGYAVGIKKLLSILQTSSPSYILMASIDHCIRLLKSNSSKIFEDYERNLANFRDAIAVLINLSMLNHDHDPQHHDFYALDPGRIVIITKNTTMSGFELTDKLRTEYKIELDRADKNYAIAITSICDPPESFTRLATALNKIGTNGTIGDGTILSPFS